MIRVDYEKYGFQFNIYCDACNKRIIDVKDAIVIWKTDTNDKSSQLYFLHRGKCDKFISDRLATVTGNEQLDQFLVKLLANLGMISIEQSKKDRSYIFDEIIEAIDHVILLNSI